MALPAEQLSTVVDVVLGQRQGIVVAARITPPGFPSPL